ncbi:hypothetical protein [Azospirillum canadense]|uniref:hypothetical protein n=1 Tax=Azospirillum canadense TaxID=403962 RepID=UPI0022273E27|nr:hypothetical protein [Azospirillum canadense]MCW2242098.1 hypothetical protein [Azospirillum canadense]
MMPSRLPLRSVVRAAATWAARNAVLWSALVRLQNTSRRGDPWLRVHPFDADHGTRTSGYIPAWLLRAGRPGDAGITAYAGCQPSCLRAVLWCTEFMRAEGSLGF